MGYTTSRARTYACFSTDRSRTYDKLISVEDCCLISVGVEGVSRVLHYKAGALVELYYIQLLLINPKYYSL